MDLTVIEIPLSANEAQQVEGALETLIAEAKRRQAEAVERGKKTMMEWDLFYSDFTAEDFESMMLSDAAALGFFEDSPDADLPMRRCDRAWALLMMARTSQACQKAMERGWDPAVETYVTFKVRQALRAAGTPPLDAAPAPEASTPPAEGPKAA